MTSTQRLLLTVALVCSMHYINGQSAINFKVGVIDRKFGDESNLIHNGQSAGLDVIVEDSRLLFMPGFHYQRYEIVGSGSHDGVFDNRNNIHQISVPMSLGTWIAADKWFKIRAYGGGHMNFIVGVDKNTAGLNLDRVQTVHPGWQVGGQLMFWKLTADVRYYRDYRNVIISREHSTVGGWEFLLGLAL